MITTKQIVTLLLGASLLFFGCRTDDFDIDTNTTPEVVQQFFETQVEGFVVDENGAALQDATITFGTATALTNRLGYFEISGFGNENYAVISVEKDQYFKTHKTYVPSKNTSSTSQLRIQLTQRNASGTLQSSAGGEISIDGQTKVDFQPNSIVDSSGNPFDGPVVVYAHYIDPSDRDIDEIMPGNLLAIDSEEEMAVLQSFGMVNVELESTSGEALNINGPATLSVQIPQSLRDNAPATLSLWFFDDADGLWKEEGTAEIQGDVYIGEVNHFTTWNCDVPSDVTFIEGQIVDAQGVPAVQVFFENPTTGARYYLYTDSDGYFIGVVPRDIELTLFVEALCDFDGFLYSETVGPFESIAEDLGVINVSNNNGFTTVSGVLVDCNMNPVTDGEVYFKYPLFGYTIQTETDDNGSFSLLIPFCDDEEIEVRGIDLSTGLVSNVLSTTVTAGEADLESLSVCIDVSPALGDVTIIYDNGQQNKTFVNCGVTISQGVDRTTYVFSFQEFVTPSMQPISYLVAVADFNSNLDFPDWDDGFAGYSPPDLPDSAEYEIFSLVFGIQSYTATVLQPAEFPGEILSLRLDGITLNYRIKNVSSESFPNATVIFNGVVSQ